VTRNTLREIKSWAEAGRLKLYRESPCKTYTGLIESGVNYFVLALEQLGAVTQYSCEGHPNNFYILFSAPQEVAENVRACGFFTVELEGPDTWSIRIHNNDITESARKRILQLAAQAWTKKFGPLVYSQERKHALFSELVFR
jgi:hypothetical protein